MPGVGSLVTAAAQAPCAVSRELDQHRGAPDVPTSKDRHVLFRLHMLCAGLLLDSFEVTEKPDPLLKDPHVICTA